MSSVFGTLIIMLFSAHDGQFQTNQPAPAGEGSEPSASERSSQPAFIVFFALGLDAITTTVRNADVKPLEIVSLVAVIAVAATVARTERENRLNDTERTIDVEASSRSSGFFHGLPTATRIVQLEISIFALFLFTTLAAGTAAVLALVLAGEDNWFAALATALVVAFLIIESSTSLNRVLTSASVSNTRNRAIAWAAIERLLLNRAENPTPRWWWLLVTALIAAESLTQWVASQELPATTLSILLKVGLIVTLVAIIDIISSLSALRSPFSKILCSVFGAVFALVAIATSFLTTLLISPKPSTAVWFIIIQCALNTFLVALLIGRVIGRTGHGLFKEFGRTDLQSTALRYPRPGSLHVGISTMIVIVLISASTLLAAVHIGDGAPLWGGACVVLLLTAPAGRGADPWKASLAIIPAAVLILLVVSAGQHEPSGRLSIATLSIAVSLQIISTMATLMSIPTGRLASGPVRSLAIYLRIPALAAFRYNAKERRQMATSLLQEPNSVSARRIRATAHH